MLELGPNCSQRFAADHNFTRFQGSEPDTYTNENVSTVKPVKNYPIITCRKGSILQCFRPSLSYHLSLRSVFCLFLSGPLNGHFSIIPLLKLSLFNTATFTTVHSYGPKRKVIKGVHSTNFFLSECLQLRHSIQH